MRLLLITGVLAFIVLTGCSKESFEDAALVGDDDQVVLIYKETQCADPWSSIELTTNGPEYSNENIAQILSYMEINGIEVTSISYEFDNNIITCLECHCASGGIYYLVLPYDESNLSALFEIGFTLQ